MNKNLIAGILVASLGIGFPSVTFADKSMTPAEREKKLDKMAKELNLSQDQKNQVRSIKDEKYNKIEAAKTEAQGKIRAVLNPEQQGKFDKMLEKKD